MHVPKVFTNRAFALLWVGQSISGLGDAIRGIVTLLWIYSVSGESGLAVAATTLMQFGPAIFVNPIVGVFADRWNQRKVMLWSDVIRAGLSLVQVLAVITGQILLAYVAMAAASLVASFFNTAQPALLPQLVAREDLQEANGATITTQQIIFIVGPALGAALYHGYGAQTAFLLDGLSYLFSAATLFMLTTPTRARAAQPPQRIVQHTLSDFKAGLLYIRHTGIALISFLVSAGVMFSAGINNIVVVFFLSNVLHRNPADIAWLGATNGVVQMITGGTLTLLAKKASSDRVLVVTTLLMALGGAIIVLSPTLPVLIIGVVTTSLGNAPFNIAQATLRQQYVAREYIGRVHGVLGAAGISVFLLGSGVAGSIVELLGPRALLLLSAISLAGTACLTCFCFAPLIRGMARAEVLPERLPSAHRIHPSEQG